MSSLDKELLEELYWILVNKGPEGQIEFWDPTGDAVADLEDYISQNLPLV